MKALIVIREKDSGWLRDFFPAIHPAMTPICNKPLLEYHMDFALLSGCTAVRIVMDEGGNSIEEYFQQGERWGVAISYGISNPDDSIDTLIEKNGAFCADTPLLIMDGFFFVHYDKAGDLRAPSCPADSGLLSSCSSGSVLFAANADCLHNISDSSLEADFALSSLTSLDDIFGISMQILQAEQDHYVLPGYGVEQNVLLGQNVTIEKNTKIIPPVIIGDNVRLHGNTVIGPDVVIGSDVIVDNGTRIERSVIHTDSYVGRDLFVNNRIVHGKRIISPADGEILDISDGYLCSSMDMYSGSLFRRTVNSVSALLIFVVQLLPYFLLGGLRKLQGSWQVEEQSVLLGNRGESLTIPILFNRGDTLADKLFAALALEKFPLLHLVIKGKMQLVGNRPLSETPAHQKLLADFPDYLPGVFTYAEGEEMEEGGLDEEIIERYHAANRSFRHDCGILLKILFSNGFTRKTAQ